MPGWTKTECGEVEKFATFALRINPDSMENHIKLTPGFHSSYIRQFQVALTNFLIVDQEEKMKKRRHRPRARRRVHAHESD